MRRLRQLRRAGPAVGLVVVVALTAGCATTGEPAQTAATEVRRVDGTGPVQTVVPRADGLSQVTVTTATFGEPDGVDGVLELAVVGAGQRRLTAADGSDLRDNAPVTLAFPPLADSAGETIELRFRYAGDEPLGLYAAPSDPYPDGRLADGTGDLAFTLGHADRVGGMLAALGRTATETIGNATSDVAFLVVWLLALAAATAGIIRPAWRRR